MLAIRRMPDMGERAYAYAKACGIIGKSFIGKRINGLEKAGRLSELDRLIFPLSPNTLPEKELLHDLEKRIVGRSVDSIVSIVGAFSNPPEFLSLLLRSYEYADLFAALTAAREKERTAPPHVDLGPFQTVRFEAWPDLPAMVKGTAFEFLLDNKNDGKKKNADASAETDFLQSALDRHYYEALWKALFSLPARDRRAAEKILSDEISLKNSAWALRLRTYYRMRPDEVKPYLIDLPLKGKKARGKKSASLADDAETTLEFPLDNSAAWSSWRWKEFLNTEGGFGSDGRQWRADPRHFQNAASRYLYRLAKHHFHLNPSSLDTVFCFIKLKQFEEDILTSGAEGLGVGMSVRDVISMLGVEP